MSADYIHKRKGWPELHWDDGALTVLLAKIRHAQGKLLGRMEELGFRLRGEAGLTVLTEEVVKSSAIEGEVLDARQVRSSLARRMGLETGGTIPATRAVEGVVEMMLDATRNYSRPLTAKRLFGWHAALFPTGYSGLRRITVGAWRGREAGPMQVVSGPIGHERVHFEAPEATRVPGEMNTFLAWFNAPPCTDPVLHAALAHFRFVTIHPLEDGNGRIARAITDMALARADGSPDRFYSMSAQIESERRDYYSVLERSQKGGLDSTAWLVWFLECLGRSLTRAEGTLQVVLHKARIWQKIGAARVNDRQRKVINRMLDGFEGKLTSSKYAALTGCSADTALRDIQELSKHGVFVRNDGSGRSTSYRIADPAGIAEGDTRE
jgi:Fic family protein